MLHRNLYYIKANIFGKKRIVKQLKKESNNNMVTVNYSQLIDIPKYVWKKTFFRINEAQNLFLSLFFFLTTAVAVFFFLTFSSFSQLLKQTKGLTFSVYEADWFLVILDCPTTTVLPVKGYNTSFFSCICKAFFNSPVFFWWKPKGLFAHQCEQNGAEPNFNTPPVPTVIICCHLAAAMLFSYSSLFFF